MAPFKAYSSIHFSTGSLPLILSKAFPEGWSWWLFSVCYMFLFVATIHPDCRAIWKKWSDNVRVDPFHGPRGDAPCGTSCISAFHKNTIGFVVCFLPCSFHESLLSRYMSINLVDTGRRQLYFNIVHFKGHREAPLTHPCEHFWVSFHCTYCQSTPFTPLAYGIKAFPRDFPEVISIKSFLGSLVTLSFEVDVVSSSMSFMRLPYSWAKI